MQKKYLVGNLLIAAGFGALNLSILGIAYVAMIVAAACADHKENR